MNQNQFANVLIRAMPYYNSYSTKLDNYRHMCYAIAYSPCSRWECKRATTKIRKLLYPNTTLYGHFVDSNFIYLGTNMASSEYHKKALTFWAIQIALGKNYISLATEILSSYLIYNEPEGWKTAQKILNRYVK